MQNALRPYTYGETKGGAHLHVEHKPLGRDARALLAVGQQPLERPTASQHVWTGSGGGYGLLWLLGVLPSSPSAPTHLAWPPWRCSTSPCPTVAPPYSSRSACRRAAHAPRTARTRRTTWTSLCREAAVAEHATRRAANLVCEVAAIGARDCNRRQQVKHHQVC